MMPSSNTQSHEAEQILYLKRLIVTLKQQFEKNLHELNEELHVEQSRNRFLQSELDGLHLQIQDSKSHHEDELKALKEQQLVLRDLLKKAQEELHLTAYGEKIVPEGLEINADVEGLNQEINAKQRKISALEKQLEQERENTKNELDHLRKTLAFFEDQDTKHEIITSNTSSYQLRQELELIKQTLIQDVHEAKNLETRYAELFHEKMHLENQLKQQQMQLENQADCVMDFKTQLEEFEQQKKSWELLLQQKDLHLSEEAKTQAALQQTVQQLEQKCYVLSCIQERYEELKEEHLHLSRHLDETIQLRLDAELQLEKIDGWAREQATQFMGKCSEVDHLMQERVHLQTDVEHLHEMLGEAESRLKVAQQHLAKKVKESALLVEKVEEQQSNIADYLQFIDAAKSQITQLQTSMEHYQKQEQKLQEQLHEALKSTENQVAKWEKKYFEMYDKWQESENQARELRKFEEKHVQMQSLLANLGNFMGSSISPGQLYQAMQENKTTPSPEPIPESISESLSERLEVPSEKADWMEERYDLFGMPTALDKSKPVSLHE